MTDVRSDAAREPRILDHPEQILERSPTGGFTLKPRGGQPTHLVPADDGRRVEGPEGLHGYRLAPAGEGSGGFVLRAPEGDREAGRTLPLEGFGRDARLIHLMSEDGRLFRIVLRGTREIWFELQGWETPGAYLVARPVSEGWKISPTAACGGLSEISALSILFAAEILEADE